MKTPLVILRERVFLAAILVLAAFLRFYQLDAIPPGFQFDQAFNAFDLLRLLQGQFAIFFPANTGREPLYFYLSMPSVAVFGTTAFAIKLTSAVIGLVTIPLIYGFTRSFFTPSPYREASPQMSGEKTEHTNVGDASRPSPFIKWEGNAIRIALLAAFFSAVSFWHIFFSRDGLRVILEVPLTLLTFWYLWRALKVPTQSKNLTTKAPHLHLTAFGAVQVSHKESQRKNFSLSVLGGLVSWWYLIRQTRLREKDWLKVGLFLALALYTYPSARLLPLAIIFLVAYVAWNERSLAREYIKGVGIALAVAAILVAPLGVYFVLHPDEFIAHTGAISVFDPRVSEGNILAAVWKNLMAILGMFFVQGDGGSIHNLPNRPIFDPFVGALFLLGAAIMLIALFVPFTKNATRDRAVFLVTWIVVSLASSLFSDDAPNFLRLLPALPPIMMLPAWGASVIWDRLSGSSARRVGVAALSLILAISAALTYRDYFVAFANEPALYYTFDADKVDVANWINQNSNSNQIFLAPLWYQQGTISLLTHNAPLKTFESRDTIILPSHALGRDAIYGYPPEQDRKIETLATRLGSLGARDDVMGTNRATILLAFRVPFKNLPDPQDPFGILTRGGSFIQPQKIERANWSNQLELLGYTLDPGTGGRNPTIILFLRSLAQMSEDYTFSIKVRDDKNRVWGQEDKWTGDNSYETSHWGVGDLVIEKFYPGLNPCAPVGNYRLSVEAYDPNTGKVLALNDREGSAVQVGTMRAGASSGNRLEDLEPEQAKEIRVGNALQLIGYTLTPDQLHIGESFSLSLFWRGVGVGSAEKIAVRLGDAKLIETTIQVPDEGRGVCAFYDLTVSPSLAPGASSIWVNDKQIAPVQLAK